MIDWIIIRSSIKNEQVKLLLYVCKNQDI